MKPTKTTPLNTKSSKGPRPYSLVQEFEVLSEDRKVEARAAPTSQRDLSGLGSWLATPRGSGDFLTFSLLL